MIAKKKGAFGAAICVVALFLSVFINPTVSRFVLNSVGAILQTVITSPPMSVTFMDGETEVHKEEALSHGMKLINLKTSYESYTTSSDDLGENTISFANKLKCPECDSYIGIVNDDEDIGIVNDDEYIGCACGVKFEGWMNATGNVPDEVTVLRNFVLNAKWNIPDKYHLSYIDVEGNIVLQKQFNATNRSVTITSEDANKLNAHATKIGEELTEEADSAFTVIATWENYDVAGTYTMPKDAGGNTVDITVNLNLSFNPTNNANASVTLEPHKYADGTVIDTNGDGFPDSYKVIGAAQNSDNVYITIPDYMLGSPITEIADGAFAGFSDLRDIYIPSTVTRIGADAFTQHDRWRPEFPQIQIIYDGTREQWKNKIAKDGDWDRNIGTNSTIVFLQEPTIGYENLSGQIILAYKDAEWEWVGGSYPSWFTERYPDLVEYANSFHQ